MLVGHRLTPSASTLGLARLPKFSRRGHCERELKLPQPSSLTAACLDGMPRLRAPQIRARLALSRIGQKRKHIAGKDVALKAARCRSQRPDPRKARLEFPRQRPPLELDVERTARER